jgi:decaprenyl-phosphate phosphoribosyltransferase
MVMDRDTSPEIGPPANLAVGILQALRPRQWLKNVLVIAAPLATLGGNVHYDYRDIAYKVAVAFVVFCLAASSTYTHEGHGLCSVTLAAAPKLVQPLR